MLGIIFTGGESPRPQVIKQIIGTEALIIAADSGLDAAEDAGIKPAWITGDMDSLNNSGRLALYPPQNVIRHERDKDFTDTELAFSLALEKGCEEIWIIGGGGGRIDHLFGIRSLFERDTFPHRWITAENDIRCIDKNLRCNDYKTEKGDIVSVFPLGDGPWEAKSTGLKWPLDGLKWNRGFFGLSNIAIDGDFSITVYNGRFMVILPLTGVISCQLF